MKKNYFTKSVIGFSKAAKMFFAGSVIVLLFSGISLNAQSTAVGALSDPSAQEDQVIDFEQFTTILEGKNFIPSNQAILALENRFVEFDDLFSSGSLNATEEVFHGISQQFTKYLYVDISNGKGVKEALEDNVDNLLIEYSRYGGANFTIDPLEIFNSSVVLLSL